MADIRTIALDRLDPNPYRNLIDYPWIETKLEQLQYSIADVGMWEGVIARPHGDRFQLAFGHHRVEAARRNGLHEIPIIIKDLTEQQMMQYMGRENGDDYRSDFLIMLNTWEGAVDYNKSKEKGSGAPDLSVYEPINVAELLGWVRTKAKAETKRDGSPRADTRYMTDVASVCYAAHNLILAGHLARSTLEGISIKSARELVGRTQTRIAETDAMAGNATPEQIQEAKRHIREAVATVADKVRGGEVAQVDIRGAVDVEAFRFSRDAYKVTPLFADFGVALIKQIERMLNTDKPAARLGGVRAGLDKITEHEDRELIGKLGLALGHLAERATDWRKKMAKPSKRQTQANKKVVQLTAISGGREP
jgi:hypothetical protein